MISALAPLFVGDFAHYREILVLADDPRPSIPARDMLNPEGLERVLATFARQYPGGDPRALVSQWSRTYFLRLTVPTVAANLVLGRELPVNLETLQVVLGEDGLAEAFKVPHEGRPWQEPPTDPFERFHALLDLSFSPLIDGLNRQVKISRKVLWSNAANYFEWLIGTMGRLSLPEALLQPGRALLDAECRPDGSRNPMFQPVRYIERSEGPSPLRQRRHCCIRYKLPELALCENCPHIDCPPKGARLPEPV